VNIVSEVFGVMTAKKADSVIVITSGLFTQDAKNLAAGKPIDLLDGTQLLQLIGNVQKGRAFPRTATSSSLCPKCGGEMVLRTAFTSYGFSMETPFLFSLECHPFSLFLVSHDLVVSD
jgi:restriction system protein